MPIILIYDGQCRFCRKQAERLQAWSGHRLQLQSFQEPGVIERYPGLTRDACDAAMQLVMPDGSIRSGAQAAAAALALNPRWRWLASLYTVPVIRLLSDRIYEWIAHNRYRFSGHDPEEAASNRVSRIWLRLLGIVYAMAFGSLAVQVNILIGRKGLLPLNEYIAFGVSDAVLQAGAWLGVLLALLLAAGFLRRPILALLGVLYLTYVTAGRDFFYFQWDSLLIECTFLSLLLNRDTSNRVVVFLFRWLLFRVYFESGLSKVLPGSMGWMDLSALSTYYETAPLPTWLGWYFHQLPLAMHRFCAAWTLFMELVVPFFIFAGRRLRRVAFGLFTYFQIILIATANYGFFNYLVLALQIFLLDEWSPALRQESPLRTRLLRGLAVLMVGFSLIEFFGERGIPFGIIPTPVLKLTEMVETCRLVNVYHLFGSMTEHRLEVEIQGTLDGKNWESYEWRYKPGRPERPPPFVAPHQPRVDFLAWFLTLGGSAESHYYFGRLVDQLCRDPEAVAPLFERLPFDTRRPAALRIAFYQYHFTDRQTRRRTGDWWSRQLLGYNRDISQCR